MKKTLIVLIIIVSVLLIIFLIRIFSPKEIDDVSPEIPCEQECLAKADILWVIPKFNGKSISENKEWCENILSLNKTLGLHGVTHEFEEFGTDRNQEYLDEGIKFFVECFGFKPTMFKPPQLEISSGNKRLIANNSMILKGTFNQIFHKVYHCNDTGRLKNKWIDLI